LFLRNQSPADQHFWLVKDQITIKNVTVYLISILTLHQTPFFQSDQNTLLGFQSAYLEVIYLLMSSVSLSLKMSALVEF